MAEVLNLNNEVVMMRKEVKKARALIIRKLTRQITKLKKKKGKEVELEKNQRRAARLLEEIHEMKTLKPDHVTKTALMKNLSFEKVCKTPTSTLTERAIVRIATHPQISKRILEIKAALEAFKEERRKPAEGKASKPVKPVDDLDVDADSGGNNDDGDEVEEKEERVGANKGHSSPVKDGLADRTEDDIKVTPPSEETTEVVVQPEEKSEILTNQKSLSTAHTLESSLTLPTKAQEKPKPIENKTTPQNKSVSRVEVKGPGGQEEGEEEDEEEKEESDLEPSDDEVEKEYFDDSTEERFCKQSSQSEDSEDEDDFFLGKVSKFKKKKSEPSKGDETRSNRDKSGGAENKPMVKGQGKQDSKSMKLESVFCNALSGRRATAGNHGSGPSGFSKPQRFQNDRKRLDGTQTPGRFHNRGGGYDRNPMPSKFQNQNPRGGSRSQDRGQAATRGRPQFEKHRNHRDSTGRAPNPSQHAQQALHPSWEASKRRKEQQAQITVFQGKKIKFDDD